MTYELKRLSERGLDGALQKAVHYRDLNQPEEAESICRDILDVVPDHQEALKTLGLALTDRFMSHWQQLFDPAVAVFGKLRSEYDRVYYVGVAWERLAKAQLEGNQAHNAAHAFERALEHYDRAQRMAPESADPVLRWNRCVRAMKTHPDLLAALEDPRDSGFDYGD